MTRKQEINAIYDRLCWMLCGARGCSTPDVDCFWETTSSDQLQAFIESVSDVWQLQDAGDVRLMNTCYIGNWSDLNLVAEIIYNGGGRINKLMDVKKVK